MELDKLVDVIVWLRIINAVAEQSEAIKSIPEIKDMIEELYGYIKSLKLVKVIEYTWAPGVIEVFEDVKNIVSNINIAFFEDVKTLSMSGSISILQAEQ